jgi:hypothetical protein
MKLGESEGGKNVVRKHYFPLAYLRLDSFEPCFLSLMEGNTAALNPVLEVSSF